MAGITITTGQGVGNIIGDRQGLLLLRDAIDAALNTGQGSVQEDGTVKLIVVCEEKWRPR